MTRIDRLQRTGIFRTGTPKRGLTYKRADGNKLTAENAARIRALKIPPAWTNVAISASANGRLQAVGRDTAGRWQYIYHENHTRAQELRKFTRLTHFIEDLPRMR